MYAALDIHIRSSSKLPVGEVSCFFTCCSKLLQKMLNYGCGIGRQYILLILPETWRHSNMGRWSEDLHRTEQGSPASSSAATGSSPVLCKSLANGFRHFFTHLISHIRCIIFAALNMLNTFLKVTIV